MVDFLLDLADPWAYLVVFALAFAEGAALVGLFLPGETAMLLGGFLVSQGRASLGMMLFAGGAGSVLGDSAGYWMGRRFSGRLRSSRLGRKIGDRRWESADAFIRRRGRSAVFAGRFMGFLRTLVPPLAGSGRMPYAEFVAFNAPAAMLWSTAFILLGVGAGDSWEALSHWAGRASILVVAIIVFAAGVFAAVRWASAHASTVKARARALLDTPTARRARKVLRPQLEFVARRLDPSERFGLSLTLGVTVAVGAAIALGGIVEGLEPGEELVAVDAFIIDLVDQRRAPQVDGLMRVLAALGSPAVAAVVVAGVAAAVAIVLRQAVWALFALVLVGGSVLVGEAAAAGLDVLGLTPSAGARRHGEFPSGELTCWGAAGCGIGFLVARVRSWTAALATFGCAVLVSFAAALALVYLGRQTPSALAAGLLVGVGWGAVCVAASDQLQRRTRVTGWA